MNYKLSLKLLKLGLLIGIPLIVLAYLFILLRLPKLGLGFMLAGGGIGLLAVLQAWFLYRCPHCRKLLGFKEGKGDTCLSCGRPLV